MEKLIAGRYRVLRCIGRGGMSAVYLVEDIRLKKQWALKSILKPQSSEKSEREKKSILAELTLLKSLQHPGIPRIVDMYESDYAWFLIMDYVEGESLQTLLEKGRQFTDREIEEILKTLCEILIYLHGKKLVYRDLKPANIMMTAGGRLYLVDYGTVAEECSDGKERAVTPEFAAPEQLQGGRVDARADIYALGSLLVYIYRKQERKMPRQLRKLTAKCLQKSPGRRCQTVKRLLHQLEVEHDRKRKLLRRGFLFALLILLFVIGTGQRLEAFRQEKRIQDLLLAEKESRDGEEKLELAEKLITLQKGKTEVYFALLDAIRFDGVFSKSEEEKLKELYFENRDELIAEEDYADFCFEVGMLYWNCYEEENANSVSGIVKSGGWFEDAISLGGEEDDFYQRALICKKISDFYETITLAEKEARDGGMYKQCFEDLEEMLELAEKTEPGEEREESLFRAQAVRLCLSSLESYMVQMYRDGVKEAEMEGLHEMAAEEAKKLPESGEKLRKLKEDCLQSEKRLAGLIQNTYRGGKEDEE